MQLSRRLLSSAAGALKQESRPAYSGVKYFAAEVGSDISSEAGTVNVTGETSDAEAAPGNETSLSVKTPQRYTRWINQYNQKVIGGEDDCATIEQFRRANQSLPRLEGQMVKAHVVAVDRHCVVIDTGLQATQTFFKNELQNVNVYDKDGAQLGIPSELQVGDILHVKIEMLQTPFGDTQLSLGGLLSQADQVKRVLSELEHARVTKQSVMGRVLNPVNRGYAVGIGGLVCFCPITQCMYATAQRVGVLQPFTVSQIRLDSQNVVVYDATMYDATAFRKAWAGPSGRN